MVAEYENDRTRIQTAGTPEETATSARQRRGCNRRRSGGSPRLKQTPTRVAGYAARQQADADGPVHAGEFVPLRGLLALVVSKATESAEQNSNLVRAQG